MVMVIYSALVRSHQSTSHERWGASAGAVRVAPARPHLSWVFCVWVCDSVCRFAMSFCLWCVSRFRGARRSAASVSWWSRGCAWDVG